MSEKTEDLDLPAAADLARLVESVRPFGWGLYRDVDLMEGEIYATEAEAEASSDEKHNRVEVLPVFISLTVGWTPATGGWSWQTGDNSFDGGAYGHPVWAVVSVASNSDAVSVAEEILDQLAEQASA